MIIRAAADKDSILDLESAMVGRPDGYGGSDEESSWV
jgi:hypothetical protein